MFYAPRRKGGYISRPKLTLQKPKMNRYEDQADEQDLEDFVVPDEVVDDPPELYTRTIVPQLIAPSKSHWVANYVQPTTYSTAKGKIIRKYQGTTLAQKKQRDAKLAQEKAQRQQQLAAIAQLDNTNARMPTLPKAGTGRIEQYTKYMSAKPNYQLQPHGFLQAFPQWINRQGAKNTQVVAQKSMLSNTYRELKNPNAEVLKNAGRLNPEYATWDVDTGRWVGKVPDTIQKQIDNRTNNLERRLSKANQLISTKQSYRQIQATVPQVVQQLVAANNNLSQVGFGPVSYNGLGLYAGRWVDPVTGSIRVLPTASQKYINPGSLAQKLGYLEAKLLNHWNTFVATYEQYLRFSNMTEQQYANKAIKSIKNGMDISGLIIKYANSINNTIMRYTLNPDKNNQKNTQLLLLNNIGPTILEGIYNIGPPQVQDTGSNRGNKQLIDALLQKQARWQKEVTSSSEQISNAIEISQELTQYQKQKMSLDLARTTLRLMAGPGRSMVTALKKAEKMALIPDDLTEKDIMKIAEAYDTASSATNKLVQGLTGKGYTAQDVATINYNAKQFGIQFIKEKPNTQSMFKAIEGITKTVAKGAKGPIGEKIVLRPMTDVRLSLRDEQRRRIERMRRQQLQQQARIREEAQREELARQEALRQQELQRQRQDELLRQRQEEMQRQQNQQFMGGLPPAWGEQNEINADQGQMVAERPGPMQLPSQQQLLRMRNAALRGRPSQSTQVNQAMEARLKQLARLMRQRRNA